MTPTPKTIRGSEYEMLAPRCKDCGTNEIEHGGVDVLGKTYCEFCFDKIDLEDKLEGSDLRAALVERYGAGAFDFSHDAREVRDGR